MRFQVLAPLLAVGVSASLVGKTIPECTAPSMANPDTSGLGPVKPFADALIAINSSTLAFNDIVSTIKDVNQVKPVLAAAADLENVISTQNGIVAKQAKLPESQQGNAAQLLDYTSSLSCSVGKTIQNLEKHKDIIVKLCEGPTALAQLKKVQTLTLQIISTIQARVPDSLAPLVPNITSDLKSFIADGITEFTNTNDPPKDQCPAIPTSTGTSTTGPTSTTNPGGVATPTGTGSVTNYLPPTYTKPGYVPPTTSCESSSPSGGAGYSAPAGGASYSAPAGGASYSAPAGGASYTAPAGGASYTAPAGGNGASPTGSYSPPPTAGAATLVASSFAGLLAIFAAAALL